MAGKDLMHPEENFQVRRDPKRTDQFALAQYSALREEVKWIIGQVDALETTSLIFSGAVWAWIATQQKWKPIYYYVMKSHEPHVWPVFSRFGPVKLVARKPKSHGAYAGL
jgi:hypothetical protein